ncbi:hypothetical protein TWF730_002041 [Orbilia blumenaviensis]|uniref:Nucleoside phosphorylase domain-containing protein n=1 Tax=Orbilia blumenaviensis TaxID=1796055 RepID=A0AAV9UDR6_9PEZI
MSDPKNYSVGWICAISTESIAANLFLDEIHEDAEPIPQGDNNVYTVGKMGKHNVVIATLPYGEYGVSSAASVARDMLRTFPNIRIGLMVGIGGGAPTRQNDIRLGDVVVSFPRGGNSGVFKYDFGKVTQNQEFQHTGFLNQPPALVRAAVGKQKDVYEMYGNGIQDKIKKVLRDKKRLERRYKQPDPNTDKLYLSSFVHPTNDDRDCEEVCGDAETVLVDRNERDEEDDFPKIHYGLIASADKLMKDALVRDRLAQEHSVLCFEMEAAGLMNHFPCLVIRGICDYSDSHKNKKWQGYAAMTAAAYAKDLLSRIAPTNIEAEKRISDSISQIQGTLVELQGSISDVQEGVGELRNEQLHRTRNEILEWLTPIDYFDQQAFNLRKQQPGSCQWFLEHTKFQKWLDHGIDKRIMFCPGIPGAGKTILTAMVINQLQSRFREDPKIGIAYFYCNFQRHNEQKIDDILMSLLKQLTQQQISIPDVVQGLYKKCTSRKFRPHTDEIIAAIHSVSKLYTRVFFLIDALDECQVEEGCRTKLLSQVLEFHENLSVNFFLTSRYVADIQEKLNSKGTVALPIRAEDGDIRVFIDGYMPRFLVRSVDDALKKEIEDTVLGAAGGMFLLVPLHMDTLAQLPTVGHLELVLKNLPRGLDATYNQAMGRIEKQGEHIATLAKLILSWATYAKRQLSIGELQEAIATSTAIEETPGGNELNRKFVPTIETIGSICAGLIVVDAESGIVRLAHYTIREYFEGTGKSWIPDAESRMATACLTYLSFRTFDSGYCRTRLEYSERQRVNQLYQYAALNWASHMSPISRKSVNMTQALHFLNSIPSSEGCMQVIISMKYPWLGWKHIQQLDTKVPSGSFFTKIRWTPGGGSPVGVHLAAFLGLRAVIEEFISQGVDLDAKDGFGRTPLAWSAASGSILVSELLLDNGANINTWDYTFKKPFDIAAEGGYLEFVQLLVDRDAKFTVETTDSKTMASQALVHKTTMLHEAVQMGYTEIFRMLLEGIALDNIDLYKILISLAVERGRTKILRILLDKTADIDVQGIVWDHGFFGEALSLAGALGQDRFEEAKLILKRAVGQLTEYPPFPQPLGLTNLNIYMLLTTAIECQRKDIVELLIKWGIDINIGASLGDLPIKYAIRLGSKSIAMKILVLLLDAGANLESRDLDDYTPLFYAAGQGNSEAVALLLEKGANIYAEHRGGGLLSVALNFEPPDDSSKYMDMIESILAAGADTEHRDGNGETALVRAIKRQHKLPIISLLINWGANIEARCNLGQTPLMNALQMENRARGASVSRFLLDQGADVGARSPNGWTPLFWAVSMKHRWALGLILGRGAEINIKDNVGMTPLMLAVNDYSGGEDSTIIELLLDGGASMEAGGVDSGGTMLHISVKKGSVTLTRKLLERGADMHAEDGNGQTPIQLALEHADETDGEIAELFVEWYTYYGTFT